MQNYVGLQHCIIAKDLKDYIKQKIKMLEDEFYIYLTESEINHMHGLKNEIQVDNYAIDIIMR